MNNYIETIISLILIIFIFSIITNVIKEQIAVNFQYRGKVLWKSLAHIFDRGLIQDKRLLRSKVNISACKNTKALYAHPQLASLRKNVNHLPSYISATNFALAS